MKIRIRSSKSYHADVIGNDKLIGYMGEVNSREIVVEGYTTDSADMYKLRLSYSDGTQYDVAITDGKATVTPSMLFTIGNVRMQVLAVKVVGNDFQYVKKSNIINGEVMPSVDGSEPVPTYEDSVDALEKVLAAEIAAQECIDSAAAAKQSEISAANSARSAADSAASTNADRQSTAADRVAVESAKAAVDSAAVQVSADRSAIEAAEDSAQAAAENAKASADSAAVSAETASAAKVAAEGAKLAAERSEQSAATSKTTTEKAAERAAQSELNAKASESNAALSAVRAAGSETAAEAAKQEVETALSDVEEIKAYLGLYGEDEDIVGLQVDYANKSFLRLAGAYNKTAGTNFDNYEMFGGRKRCNVADDGTIVAWYGDENYIEDGSIGQVMVYQPAFYYKVVPLVLTEQTDGVGYHLRKANYYVSSKPKTGFKRHPLFFDRNGEEVDYALLSAYEGSVFDVSANVFLRADEQVMDINEDKFCSIAGAKPTSGKAQPLNRTSVETIAQNRGSDWHADLVKAESANQFLMIIEMGMMNMQTAIGKGVTFLEDNPNNENNSINTGGTSTLGNATGMANGTNGRVSVTYRGVENPWGNIWKYVNGINIYGNGNQKGGIPYICSDFNFAKSKNSDNYEGTDFSIVNGNGWISAMGYGNKDFDWLFFSSECLGNDSLPVGDYTTAAKNLNGYRMAGFGGRWNENAYGGNFYWYFEVEDIEIGGRNFGSRLTYIPTKQTTTAYQANINAWERKIIVNGKEEQP